MKLTFPEMHQKFPWFINYFFIEVQPRLPKKNPDHYVIDVLSDLGWDVDYELFPSDDNKYKYNVNSMSEEDLEKLEVMGYDRHTGKLKKPRTYRPLLVFHNIDLDSKKFVLLSIKYSEEYDPFA